MNEISRRTFLTIGSLSVVACAADQREVAPLDLSEEARTTAPLFLTKPELDFVSAAAERMIPTDDLGPGAIAAGVPEFIDRQLGGSYGQAVTWYMEGPWHKGSEEQGYQSKLTPSQMYRAAIPAIDKHCSDKYKRRFAELGAQDQDAVLTELEGGKIELDDVPAKTFFKMLLQNVQEGFLSDPMYGGNRKFIGWKLIGFPGPRYNYTAEIERYGVPYTEPTVGILGRDENIRGRA